MPSAISKFSDSSGSVAPLFGVMLLAILGTAAMGLDYGRAVNEQSRLQVALDAAVLAGASSSEDKIEVAENNFYSNIAGDLATSAEARFSAEADGRVTGAASAVISNYLAALIGHKNTQIDVTSVASALQSGKVCVLLLDPGASQALLVNGGAQISAPDCEVHSKSTGGNAAVFNAGTDLDTKRLCLQGDDILDNGGSHPNLEINCLTANDPFAGTLPAPSSTVCDHNNQTYSGASVTISPGVYCGWTNFNAGVNVTLNPGLYVIKGGGWNANGGDWTGAGVTFYFDDTSYLQFNSSVKVDLTAPLAGPYENIIFFEKEGLAKSNLPIDDSRGFNITGIMYLPSRNLIFNGGSQQHAKEMAIVANTLILNQTNWTLTPGDYAFGGATSTGVVLIK